MPKKEETKQQVEVTNFKPIVRTTSVLMHRMFDLIDDLDASRIHPSAIIPRVKIAEAIVKIAAVDLAARRFTLEHPHEPPLAIRMQEEETVITLPQ